MGKELFRSVTESSTQVLYANWASGQSPLPYRENLPNYGFTRPSPPGDWYDMQYHWDSMFSTIGWSLIGQERAKLEFTTLLSRQKSDGAVPIVNNWKPSRLHDSVFNYYFSRGASIS